MNLLPKERLLLIGKNIANYIILPFRKKLVHLGTMLSEPEKEMKYKNQIKTYKGVQYRSMLEVTCAMLLAQHGIEFQYEPYEITLVEGDKYPGIIYEKKTRKKKKIYGPSTGTIRRVSYTPDFIGKGWVIETKGYETPEFKLKWKLFQLELMKKGNVPLLLKPTNKKEILESIHLIKQIQSNGETVKSVTQRPESTVQTGTNSQGHRRRRKNR